MTDGLFVEPVIAQRQELGKAKETAKERRREKERDHVGVPLNRWGCRRASGPNSESETSTRQD